MRSLLERADVSAEHTDMDLKSDQRQNIQGELDFSSLPAGEAREARREETESFAANHDPESPASTNRWIEEICERENLKQALQRVKANKGNNLLYNSTTFC